MIVWQKSMAFVTAIYKVTAVFPNSEQFGVTSQIRRSAVSVPSNIAEGLGRRSDGDFIRFLQIAMGSLFELQTQLKISFNLGLLPETECNTFFSQSREVERMLTNLIQKLKQK